jgi:hypothetical protein
LTGKVVPVTRWYEADGKMPTGLNHRLHHVMHSSVAANHQETVDRPGRDKECINRLSRIFNTNGIDEIEGMAACHQRSSHLLLYCLRATSS